jgi:hypothetical protein
MLFLTFFLSVLSLFQLVLADIQPKYDPDCITDDIALRKDYGSFDQSASFCAMQFNQGAFVSGVEVWHDDHRVSGIQISYTSSESTFAGYQVSDYAKIF